MMVNGGCHHAPPSHRRRLASPAIRIMRGAGTGRDVRRRAHLGLGIPQQAVNRAETAKTTGFGFKDLHLTAGLDPKTIVVLTQAVRLETRLEPGFRLLAQNERRLDKRRHA